MFVGRALTPLLVDNVKLGQFQRSSDIILWRSVSSEASRWEKMTERPPPPVLLSHVAHVRGYLSPYLTLYCKVHDIRAKIHYLIDLADRTAAESDPLYRCPLVETQVTLVAEPMRYGLFFPSPATGQ